MTALGYLSEPFEMLTFWETGQAAGCCPQQCSYGAQAFLLGRLASLLFFFFSLSFFACLQPSFGRVSQTEVLVSTALRRAAQAAVATAF